MFGILCEENVNSTAVGYNGNECILNALKHTTLQLLSKIRNGAKKYYLPLCFLHTLMWYGYCFVLKGIKIVVDMYFTFFKFIKKLTLVYKNNVILMNCIFFMFFKKVFLNCFMLKFMMNTIYLSDREYFCLISINVEGVL